MRVPFENEVRFAGYVGNDPARRVIPGNIAVVSLRICAKENYREGEVWKTVDEWQTAIFYRELADELIQASIKKGSFISLRGKLHTRKWAQEGHSKSTLEIIVRAWHPVQLGGLGEHGLPAEIPTADPAHEPRMRDSFKALT